MSRLCKHLAMVAREDCRHYVMQTVRSGERLERCRLGASVTVPFGCPDRCVFYERRSTSSAGWQVGGPGSTGGRPPG